MVKPLVKYPVIAAVIVAVSAAAFAGITPGEFDRLVAAKGTAVLEVLEKPTLYRVARLDDLPCDVRTFEYLIDRPRTSIVLARWADPTLDNYTIQTKPDGSSHVDDSGRLAGDMELVEAASGRRVYYLTGHWRFVMGVTFEGRMVLVPEYSGRYVDGAPYVDAATRGYMKIDNAFAGVMARLVVYIFPGKVDARIARFAAAVRKVAALVSIDPDAAYAALEASGRVSKDELKEFRATFMAGPRAGG